MRIYDTFIFDSEFELLEHRLAENYDLVDVFVLVEAAQTFQGQQKPLYFQQQRERFAWAMPKLRHVALPRLPGESTWAREAFQRNAVQLGLSDAQPDDIVLILDADEVPSRSVLQRLRADGLSRPHRLLMTRHYGRFDTLAPRSACCANTNDPFPFAVPHLIPESWKNLSPAWWCMPGVAVHFKDIRGDQECALPPRTPHALRRENQSAPRLPDAGRHLSSIASSKDLQTKLSHFSHAEFADERSLTSVHLQRTRDAGVHARGWWYAERPLGLLPNDLQRLCAKTESAEGASVSSSQKRRVVRTWAWLRHSPRMPKSCVSFVDHYYERLTPLLLSLLIVDRIRGAVAWLKMRKRVRQPTAH